MKFAVLSNNKSQIVLVHKDPVPSPIEWIEYVPEDNQFSVVFEDGTYHTLDLDFDLDMKNNIQNGDQVVVQHLSEEAVISSKIVSIVIQNY